MKIRTSIVTASFLKEQCNVSDELIKQIDRIPAKAESVYLYVGQEEMKNAVQALRKFMASSNNYHKDSFEYTLKEIEYFASCNT